MAYELHGMLTSSVSLTTEKKIMPAYERGSESILNYIVTPVYNVIYEEAEKSKQRAYYSEWRNYDDLNEYFWSPDCFQLGWPMRLDHSFFCVHFSKDGIVKEKKKKEAPEDEELGGTREEDDEKKWLGKTNFVKIRSFWQAYRSFDRIWNFLILSLQATIVIACHYLRSPLEVFDAIIFEEVMSNFITSAALNLIQGAIFPTVFCSVLEQRRIRMKGQ